MPKSCLFLTSISLQIMQKHAYRYIYDDRERDVKLPLKNSNLTKIYLQFIKRIKFENQIQSRLSMISIINHPILKIKKQNQSFKFVHIICQTSRVLNGRILHSSTAKGQVRCIIHSIIVTVSLRSLQTVTYSTDTGGESPEQTFV